METSNSHLNYFVIIGGSQSHVSFIQTVQRLGYKAVVFDGNALSPGSTISDKFYAISTHDIDAISDECYNLHKDKKLKGVITYSSYTKPLFTVATVCQELGLPSFSVQSVQYAVDKAKMRKRFLQSGIPTPEWIATDSLDNGLSFLAIHPLPVIVKPSLGSQGSKGVTIVRETSKLKDSYTNASNISQDGLVIIEKFYNGREFSVDGIVNSGKITVLAVSEKFNLGPERNFTISGFMTGPIPNEDKELRENIGSITDVALSAVRSLDIDNSFFSVDVLLTERVPLVLECGVFLDAKIDQMLYFAGVDVYEMLCRTAAGERLEITNLEFPRAYALKFMFAQKEGKLKIITKDFKLKEKEQRVMIEWERADGVQVQEPSSISDTVGWVMAEGNNRKEACYNANRILEQKHFQVI